MANASDNLEIDQNRTEQVIASLPAEVAGMFNKSDDCAKFEMEQIVKKFKKYEINIIFSLKE